MAFYGSKIVTQRKSRAERKEIARWAILVRSQPAGEIHGEELCGTLCLLCVSLCKFLFIIISKDNPK